MPTVTPFLIDAPASPSGQSIDSLRIRVGESGGGTLGISGPSWGSRKSALLSATIAGRFDEVDWIYEATT